VNTKLGLQFRVFNFFKLIFLLLRRVLSFIIRLLSFFYHALLTSCINGRAKKIHPYNAPHCPKHKSCCTYINCTELQTELIATFIGKVTVGQEWFHSNVKIYFERNIRNQSTKRRTTNVGMFSHAGQQRNSEFFVNKRKGYKRKESCQFSIKRERQN